MEMPPNLACPIPGMTREAAGTTSRVFMRKVERRAANHGLAVLYYEVAHTASTNQYGGSEPEQLCLRESGVPKAALM